MNLTKKIIKSAILLLSITAATAVQAQKLNLPARHNNAHNELLANQRPFGLPQKKAVRDKAMEDIRNREADADIFGQYWESQSVNPYGSAAVPAAKEIDVRGFVMPHNGPVTSPYGWRARFGRMHRGVDISLKVGDTVRSAFSGKVRLTKFEGKGYGYYVVVRHDNGMETVYGHLSRFLVKPNQRVRAGEPIALGGNTGRSTGPHLHFETRYMGLAVNPEGLIDFTNKTTHRDTYAFSKSSYEKSQKYGPSRTSAKVKSSKAAKGSKVSAKSSKKSKATASKKKSTKKRR